MRVTPAQILTLIIGTSAALLTGCSSMDMKMGSASAKTVATGSAAGSATSDANSALEKCTAPLGTVSLIENESSSWYSIIRDEYKLPPTANLLRLIIQQSNCFVVVERGAAGLRAMSRERQLQQSGELRKGSNFGKGKVVSSDYGLSPEIVFNEGNAAGASALFGALIGGSQGNAVAKLGGSIKTREASTLLTLIDNRSSVQIASAEGSASKSDFDLFAGLAGASGRGSIGGYSNTPQGKVIAAAFMDAFNQMVRSLRNYKAQEVKGGLGKGGQLKVGA
ncbi:CsgG/HfaB family protein [Leeia oryzae]|uniref:CsgG/HfaB family protein n=1 Tax=Leeia oryzae TaxID=356662 RepID=UPI0012EAE1C5|nr:CsgG/HfaB family protein [Leeia oryzae]